MKDYAHMTNEEQQQYADNSHQNHMLYVQESLECVDQPTTHQKDDCSYLASTLNMCRTDQSYMMLGCPKSCRVCDDKGLICTDLYLHKCPLWANEGKCTSEPEDMAIHCRYSCGLCKLIEQPLLFDAPISALARHPPKHEYSVADKGQDKPKTNHNQPEKEHKADHQSPKLKQQAPTLPVDPVKADPYVAQRQWADGMIVEAHGSGRGHKSNEKVLCDMHNKPNGNLLGRYYNI